VDGLTLVSLATSAVAAVLAGISIWFTERVKTVNQAAIEEIKAGYQHGIEEAKAEYQKDLERVKAELGRETEALRAQLGMLAFEHQTRFSRLHDRRVEVVAELYRKLVLAEDAFSKAIDPIDLGTPLEEIEHRRKEKDTEAVTTVNEFLAYSRMHEVWLTDEIGQTVGNLGRAFREVWHLYVEDRRGGGDWPAAWRRVGSEVPQLKTEIRNAMRAVLGEPPRLPPSTI
jgi:hypothetical protein